MSTSRRPAAQHATFTLTATTLLVLATAFAPSFDPTLRPAADIHALLHHTAADSIALGLHNKPHPLHMPNPSSRQAGGNATCALSPSFSRVLVLADDYDLRRPGYDVVDNDRIFFRAGLGWDTARISRSRDEALQHFTTTFGIPREKFDVPERYEPGEPPVNRLVLYSSVFGGRYNVVADSAAATGGCATTGAVWGGWQAVGRNISIRGSATQGERVTTDPRETVRLYLFYMLFGKPGQPGRRVVEFKAIRPLICGPTGCGVVATSLDLNSGKKGFVEGVSHLLGTVLKARVVLSFPSGAD